MKLLIVGTLVAAGMLALPALSLAATYQYIDTGGFTRSVTADTAEEAIRTASSISARSGVMLVSGSNSLSQDTHTQL